MRPRAHRRARRRRTATTWWSAKVATGQPAVYYAGSGWDKGGDFAAVADWDRHLDEFVRRAGSPLAVEVR